MKNTVSTSIIISTYNWPEALNLCIQSIFKQTVLPDEILIADDGSKEDTKRIIELIKKTSPIPIKHIWHEDKGFQLSAIRNKALAACDTSYAIQIDGDIILHSKFIEDHMEIAESGYFVSGQRAYISEKESKKLFKDSNTKINFWKLKNKKQVIRLPHFFNFRRLSSTTNPNKGIKGSNMAFWLTDLVKVNGYNEDLKMWGYEDREIAARLINSGLLKKRVRYKCLSYHLYHKNASRNNLLQHKNTLIETIREKTIKCKNGISKYN